MFLGDGAGSGRYIVLGCHSILLEFCTRNSYRDDDDDDDDIGGTFAFQMCVGEDGVCTFVSQLFAIHEEEESDNSGGNISARASRRGATIIPFLKIEQNKPTR
jgi:hypothetical protein